MRMTRTGAAAAVAVAVITMTAAAPARAEEPGVVKARLLLDQAEAGLKTLKAGDVPAGNALIKKINDAVGHLKGCKDRNDEGWKTQAARTQALDKAVRARLEGKDGAAPEPAPAPKPGAPAEPDAATLAAKKLQDEVAAALPTLTKGDIATANALIGKVNASRTELGKSSAEARKHPEWQAAAKRAQTLDQQVRDIASGKAPAPAPADPALENAPPLGTDDAYKFRRDFADKLPGYQKQLAAMPPQNLASEHEVKKLKDAAARMRDDLKKNVKAQDNPRVQNAYAQIAAFEAAVDAKAAEGRKLVADANARAAAEASAVDTELKEIEAFFDPKTFRCDLEPPYDADRVRDWVKRLREYQKMQQTGIAQIDRLVKEHPAYAEHPRVGNLRYVFTKVLPKAIADGIARTTDWYQLDLNSRTQGYWVAAIGHAQRLLESPPKENRLADEKDVEDILKTLAAGIEAAEAMAVFNEAYHGKKDPAHAKLAADLRALTERVNEGAKQVLAGARMPKAASTDAKLLKIAADTLKDPKYGVGKYRRMVINNDLYSKEEQKSEARIEGDYIKIWKWTEKWDQFQVCCAEEVDGKLRLVYYAIKYMHEGPSWKPVGRWYCSARLVSKRILPENVEK